MIKTVSYDMFSGKINKPLKFLIVADLHSCRYGLRQRNLVPLIYNEKSDAVLLVGDIFELGNNAYLPYDDSGLELLRELSGSFHMYYVTGNHEVLSGKAQLIKEYVSACGAKVISPGTERIKLNDNWVKFIGIDDGKDTPKVLDMLLRGKNSEDFTVLLAHRPENISVYSMFNIDLTVCGHAHGGQWRIPGILNGLYAPGQGFFPKYAGGIYKKGNMTEIVSRGLAKNIKVPRIFNPPELTVVNIFSIAEG